MLLEQLEDRRVLATIHWDGEASDSLWTSADNWSGNQLPGIDDDVVIGDVGITITHSAGSTTIKSLQSAEPLIVSGGNLKVTDSLVMSATNSISVSGASTSFVVDGPANIDGASVFVSGGGNLSLPGLQTYAAGSDGTDHYFRARGDGSELDLPALTSITGATSGHSLYIQADQPGGKVLIPSLTSLTDQSVYVQSFGANSQVDLSSLRTWEGRSSISGRVSSADARDDGEIIVDSQLTDPRNVTFQLYNSGSINTSQFLSIDGGNIYVRDGAQADFSGLNALSGSSVELHNASQIDLSNVAQAESSSFLMYTGSKLALPKLTSYRAGSDATDHFFRARGNGSELDLSALTSIAGSTTGHSLYVQAEQAGGKVRLPKVSSLTDQSVYVQSFGANSQVDFSSLQTWEGRSSVSGRVSSADARDGGEIIIPSQLTDPRDVTFQLYNTGVINTSQLLSVGNGNIYLHDGANADFSGLTSLNGMVVELHNASQIDLTNITHAESADFYAYTGSKISLPKLTGYDAGGDGTDHYFRARGNGSELDLSALTSITGSTSGHSLYVQAEQAGGKVLLPHIASLTDQSVYVQSFGENSQVDLSGLQTWEGRSSVSGRVSSADARDGGEIIIPSQLTDPRDVTFQLYNTGVINTSQLLSVGNGNIYLHDGANADFSGLTSLNGTVVELHNASQIDLTNITHAESADFYAYTGSKISLPKLTGYDAGGDGTDHYFRARGNGSELDLSALTSVTGATSGHSLYIQAEQAGGKVRVPGISSLTDQSVYVQSFGAGSQVDLSGLHTWEGRSSISGRTSSVDVRDSGHVDLDQVTEADHVTYAIHNTGSVSTSEVTSLRGADIQLYDGAMPDFGKLTSAEEMRFLVNGGSKLTLPSLTSYEAGGSRDVYFRARGAGSELTFPVLTSMTGSTSGHSLYVQADQSGGIVNLPGVSSLTDQSVYVQSAGAGSLVNLSSLQTWEGRNSVSGRISEVDVRDGGRVDVDQVTEADHVSYIIYNTGIVATSEVTSLRGADVELHDGATPDFGKLSSAEETRFLVNSGSKLTLPSLATYEAGGGRDVYFRARGAGSELTFPALTAMTGSTSGHSLYIQADQSGGKVNLPVISSIADQSVYVESHGAGSSVNLSGLQTWEGRNSVSGRISSVDVRDGGQVDIDQLTEADHVSYIIYNTGIVATSEITSLRGANVELYDGAMPDFGMLSSAEETRFWINDGSKLTLPSLVTYDSGGSRDVYFRARGAGSELNFPALTTVTASTSGHSLYIQADESGGQVNAPFLSSLNNHSVYVQSFGANSVVNLSGLQSWEGRSSVSGRRSSVDAQDGGHTVLGTTFANDVDFYVRSGAVLPVVELTLGPDSYLTGTSLIDGSLVNGGRVDLGYTSGNTVLYEPLSVTGNYQQTSAGQLRAKIGGPVSGVSLDALNVTGDVDLDGTLSALRQNNYLPQSGDSLQLISSNMVSGQFSTIEGRFFGDGIKLEPVYEASTVSLAAVTDAGPKVVSTSLGTSISSTLRTFDIVFDEPIESESINSNSISLVGPNGAVGYQSVTMINPSTARVTVTTQITPGDYTLTVGPDVIDTNGAPMDQDGDGVNGETVEDQFSSTFTMTNDRDAVLMINVHGGSYDGDGFNIYRTLLNLDSRALFVDLDQDGEAAALLSAHDFDQVWVFDLSSGSDVYPTDWAAISSWYNQDPTRAIVADGRMISSYWSGRWTGEGQSLTENYYENIMLGGGGLVLGTDHSDFQRGINEINAGIGLEPFLGNFSLSRIPVDTNSPLMTSPNNLGSDLFDDSSPGQTPFGLQPSGQILYTVAWHSGNFNTPGISSTIQGSLGFLVEIQSPADGSTQNEGTPVTLSATQRDGVEPVSYMWSSDRDGAIGSGQSLSLSTLSPGTHQITVVSQDSAGGADTDTVTLNINSVVANVQVDLDAGSDSGSSDTDNVTNDTTPKYLVTVNKTGLIEVDFDADGTFDASQQVTASGSFSFDSHAVSEGTYSVRARFTPDHGQTAENTLDVTVDTTAPTLLSTDGEVYAPFSSWTITLDEPIGAASLSASDFELTDVSGNPILITDVNVSGADASIQFDEQSQLGAYSLKIGGIISDLAGNDFAANVTLTQTLREPLFVESVSPGTVTNQPVSSLSLELSQTVIGDDARTSTNYQLLDLGGDRQVGGTDDRLIPVLPNYADGTPTLQLTPITGTAIDLSLCRETDYQNGDSGDWEVQDDGRSVFQSVNGYPTFFISDFDFADAQFVGRIKVETTSDDDHIGLVFGFSELESTGRPHDYYYFSWKQGNQGNSEAGMKLLKVSGSGNLTQEQIHDILWDGENGSYIEVLTERLGSSRGWRDNVEYDFAVTYRNTGEISLLITRTSNGQVMWNTTVTDPSPLGIGKVGFLNQSQSHVRYSGLSRSETLEEGVYQLTAFSGDPGLRTPDGILLDGNADGQPGDDFVYQFTIDQTDPTLDEITIAPQQINVAFDDQVGMDSSLAEDPALLSNTAKRL